MMDNSKEASDSSDKKIVIRPQASWMPINLKEIWDYRELIFIFTWRDIKIRYKQTALGFAWAIIQPLLMMIVFSLFFGRLANVPSDGIPYPIFAYTALLPWTLFAEGLTRSSTTMITNANVMTKVYFPRIIMPISGILSPLVDFIISFGILILMMIYFGFMPTINIVWLPVFIILAVLTSLAVGLWISALNVQYRDFQYTIPFIVQVWLFASPVVYSSTLIPQGYQMLYGLNPMAGVIEGFRWVLLGTSPPSAMIFMSFLVVIALLITGAYYFRRMEQYFADIV